MWSLLLTSQGVEHSCMDIPSSKRGWVVCALIRLGVLLSSEGEWSQWTTSTFEHIYRGQPQKVDEGPQRELRASNSDCPGVCSPAHSRAHGHPVSMIYLDNAVPGVLVIIALYQGQDLKKMHEN